MAGLGSDFVVIISQEQPHQPRAWLETFQDDRLSVERDGEGTAAAAVAAPGGAGGPSSSTAVMVALYPDLAHMVFEKDAALDFVFVIDRLVGWARGTWGRGVGAPVRACRQRLTGSAMCMQVWVDGWVEDGGSQAHPAAVPAVAARGLQVPDRVLRKYLLKGVCRCGHRCPSSGRCDAVYRRGRRLAVVACPGTAGG